uniref:Cytochrome c oxidase subunit 2 n=1 Tax=Xiphinema pachtaicum TaxID=260251 RepID=A0A1P8C799_9BILA|nr:cytochrome c oxidase subunit II [Xiphinema pachtaicum]AOT84274.1 cytochrome c oxidase subunit II [Xiphinema pachtaicum]
MLESMHDIVMIWLFVITVLVIFLGVSLFFKKGVYLSLESSLLEVSWTLVPMSILIIIAFPSIHLLCLQEQNKWIFSSLKVFSNQWNWQSEQQNEYLDHLLDVDELEKLGSFEMPVVSSSDKEIRLVLTSTDVLHSLGLPSLGVKLDSVPGRLNCTVIEAMIGFYYGSCYELCGSGHSSMPISMLFL